MSSFTPAPWHTSGGDVITEEGHVIVSVTESHISGRERYGNLELCAAAPALVDALEQAYHDLTVPQHMQKDDTLPKIRAALAQARGER